jgi:hypothetical protein
MLECPVCDFPEAADLRTILERIGDPGLIVALACDFAARVSDISPDPLETDRWLEAARNWRTDKTAAETATRAAWVAADAAKGPAFSGAAWAVWSACATTDIQTSTQAVQAAADAATARIDASGVGWKAEREWQLEHTRKLACTCITSKTNPSETRSRNSLLAH